MARDDYDPTAPNQHAQLLFDSAKDPKGLPALYEWLAARNIDANETRHQDILDRLRRDAELEAMGADGPGRISAAAKAMGLDQED